MRTHRRGDLMKASTHRSSPGRLTYETHVSTVTLEDDRAYKVKKPLKTPFLDFSSQALRRQACRREVELNRRLAPDVYLGVQDIPVPEGGKEPAVVMRRMPEHRRLAHLVRSADGNVRTELRRVARVVA